jgi:uncharacterized protein (TIGR01244 family)
MHRKIWPVLLLSCLAACASDGSSDIQVAVATATEERAQTQPAAALVSTPGGVTIKNGRVPAEGLLTGGQITPEQMTALAAEGYKTFINLRPADEEGTSWEEEFAGQAGLRFVRIPVAGHADLSHEKVDLLARTMAEGHGDGGVVLYCASSNRVGALLALKAHWVDGVEPPEALAFGRDGGMTRMEPVVKKLLGLGE